MKTTRLTLPNVWVEFFLLNEKVVLTEYSGNPERVIKELLEMIINNPLALKDLGGYDHPYFKDATRRP